MTFGSLCACSLLRDAVSERKDDIKFSDDSERRIDDNKEVVVT